VIGMVKYVYNSKGKKTGVIIPIELWYKYKSEIMGKKNVKKVKTDFQPSHYRGIYGNMEIDLEQENNEVA
jgi:hypothetical protein